MNGRILSKRLNFNSNLGKKKFIPQHSVLDDPMLELRVEVVGGVGGEDLEELGLDRVEDDLLGVLRRLEQRVVAPPTRLGGVQEEAPQGVHVLVGERGDGENLGGERNPGLAEQKFFAWQKKRMVYCARLKLKCQNQNAWVEDGRRIG